ncbi:MAG: anhydro-N-acetylmuramic acid kinase, partial [Pseudomonadota bacterium]
MAKVYTALGLMSGTSLDGVDAAIIETDGEQIFSFGPSITVPYAHQQRMVLADATQNTLSWNFDGPAPNYLAEAEEVLDQAHISAINTANVSEIDLIGYHGQTVLHRPDKRKTLQLGRGQSLADAINCPVVFDFRSEDVAAGGQGAPLAPIYHQALVRYSELPGVTAVLNLGGVGNVTIVTNTDLLATDTGPANGPLDSFLAEHDLSVDVDGGISQEGEPDFALIDQWLSRSFFKKPWPKSA